MKKVLITLKIKNMSKEIVYWKMRNGKLVSVDEMDTNHIKNAFKYLIKKHLQLVKDANVVVETPVKA